MSEWVWIILFPVFLVATLALKLVFLVRRKPVCVEVRALGVVFVVKYRYDDTPEESVPLSTQDDSKS